MSDYDRSIGWPAILGIIHPRLMVFIVRQGTIYALTRIAWAGIGGWLADLPLMLTQDGNPLQ